MRLMPKTGFKFESVEQTPFSESVELEARNSLISKDEPTENKSLLAYIWQRVQNSEELTALGG